MHYTILVTLSTCSRTQSLTCELIYSRPDRPDLISVSYYALDWELRRLEFDQSDNFNFNPFYSDWQNSNPQFAIFNLQCIIWHGHKRSSFVNPNQSCDESYCILYLSHAIRRAKWHNIFSKTLVESYFLKSEVSLLKIENWANLWKRMKIFLPLKKKINSFRMNKRVKIFYSFFSDKKKYFQPR